MTERNAGPEGRMDDDRLAGLLREADATYRVPPAMDADAMWERIEAVRSAPRLAPRPAVRATPRRWLAPAAGIAATLLVGIGIGRFTAVPASDERPIVADATIPAPPPAPNPLQRTTYEYLDETVTLLASLPKDGERGNAQFLARAHQLLGTTRMLLDSPVAGDPRLRDLLEDLELVLAQVARLRAAPRAEELTFIAEAMDERDVVPRLRVVAASLSHSDY
jgi:hypothetical protein